MNNALTSFALGQIQASEERMVFTVDGEDRPTIVTPSELVVLYKETRKELNHLKSELENKKVECNTTGENTLTQTQTTGKKSKKSTKKTTTTQK